MSLQQEISEAYATLTDEKVSEIERDAKPNRHTKGSGPSVLKNQTIISVKYHSTTLEGNNRRTIITASGYQFVTGANSHAGLDAENYSPTGAYKNGEYISIYCTVDLELNGWGKIVGFKGVNKAELRRALGD